MSLLQTPGVWERLRAQFKIREPSVVELEPTVQPVCIVEDVSGPFHASHGYPRNAMGSLTVAAGGVGTNAEGILQSPGSRGKIYVIQSVVASKATAGFIQVRPSILGEVNIAALTDLTSKGYLDQRNASVQPDIVIAAETPLTAGIHGTETGRVEVEANIAVEIELGVTLGESGFIVIMNGTTNETLTVTFRWIERLLEDR